VAGSVNGQQPAGEERRATRGMLVLIGWYLLLGLGAVLLIVTTHPSPGPLLVLGPVTVAAVGLVSPVVLAIMINARRRFTPFTMGTVAAAAGLVVVLIGAVLAVLFTARRS
jgi:hypothetical protein